MNIDIEETFSRPLFCISKTSPQTAVSKKQKLETLSSLEPSHDDVIGCEKPVSADISFGHCIIHFVQVVFNFFPYTLMNFQFLEKIFHTFLVPEVEAILKSLQGKFFCTRGAAQFIGVIIDLLWPNSKLLEVDTEERLLEEKISTEKEATCLLAAFFEKNSKFINSQQAFKTSAEIISSFRDQKINKHLMFCFIDSIMLKLFNAKNRN